MKKYLCLLFLSVFLFGFSQKKALKKVQFSSSDIEVVAKGLDNIVIENSDSNFVEVYLFDENPSKHHIVIEEQNEILTIGFEIDSIPTGETVFRKFITKRLQRASAILKVPANKSIRIFGDHIDVESKDYKGNLFISIEEGNLQLNAVQKDVSVTLYAGKVSAILKNTHIDVVSNGGKIIVDDAIIASPYKKQPIKSRHKFSVTSKKATILLNTQKVQ